MALPPSLTKNNIYKVVKGSGATTIADTGGRDTIQLGSGILATDVTYVRNGNDLVIMIAGGDSVTVKNQFASVTAKDADGDTKVTHPGAIEVLKFANGVKINLNGGIGLIQTAGSGNETLKGGAGDDTFYAGSGSDVISAGAGKNVIIAGTGTLAVTAGSGDDTYVFNKGFGNTTIRDSGGSNVIKLGAGISMDDLSFARAGRDLIVKAANGGSITIKNQFAAASDSDDKGAVDKDDLSRGIQTLVFADGTTFNMSSTGTSDAAAGHSLVTGTAAASTLKGTHGNDILLGGAGADTLYGAAGDKLYGGAGNDTYVLAKGFGTETILDTSGNDTIKLDVGLTKANIKLSRSGNDLIITDAAGDRLTIQGQFSGTPVETLMFADGTKMDLKPELVSAPVVLTANAAAPDTLAGNNSQANVLIGGFGVKTIYANGAHDYVQTTGATSFSQRLVISAGLTDPSSTQSLKIKVGGVPAGTSLSAGHDNGDGTWTLTSSDLANLAVTSSTATGFTLTVDAIATSTTSGISSVAHSTVTIAPVAPVIAVTVYANGGNDILIGGAVDNTFFGGAGNVEMHGGTKSNIFYAESGNGMMFAGDGTSTLYGGTGNNTMYGGAGLDTFFAGSGNDTVYGGTGTNFIHGGTGTSILYAGNGTSSLFGGAGKTTMFGGAGNDTFFGGSSNVEMHGGSGTNTMYAETGNDTMFAGDGTSTLYGGTGNNTMYGGAGLDTFFAGSGNDTVYGGTGTNLIHGGTGTSILYAGNGTSSLFGGAGHSIMYGGAGNDTFYGGAGNAWMRGGTGTNTMYAETGNDTMYAGNGTSTLYGGTGNNTMYGEAGHATFYAGSGNDTIVAGIGDDLMIAGTGHTTFAWTADSVVNALGLDTIQGFNGNDTIDLHAILAGRSYAAIDDVVHFTLQAGGEMMSVDLGLGQGFHNVALLAGLQNTTASDLLKSGQLSV